MSAGGGRQYVLTPWRVSLWGSSGGLVLAGLYGLVPAFGQVALPAGLSFPALYLVAPIVAISGLWALSGILRRKRDGNTFWCVLSLVFVLLSAVFIVLGAMGQVNREF